MALQKAIDELNTTTPGKGVGTLPPHLHPDLVKFIKRGGLTAMLEYYSRTSQTDEALILPTCSSLQENIF